MVDVKEDAVYSALVLTCQPRFSVIKSLLTGGISYQEKNVIDEPVYSLGLK